MEFSTILTSSLIAALISASISAWVSFILKNKDYRNEYFKKIIDKRIKAIESVEQILVIFSPLAPIEITDAGERKKVAFAYLVRNPEWSGEDEYAQAVQNFSASIMWLGLDLRVKVRDFCGLINMMRDKASKFDTNIEKIDFYAENYLKLAELLMRIELQLSNEMAVLYDIDAFVRERKKIHKSITPV